MKACKLHTHIVQIVTFKSYTSWSFYFSGIKHLVQIIIYDYLNVLKLLLTISFLQSLKKMCSTHTLKVRHSLLAKGEIQ